MGVEHFYIVQFIGEREKYLRVYEGRVQHVAYHQATRYHIIEKSITEAHILKIIHTYELRDVCLVPCMSFTKD